MKRPNPKIAAATFLAAAALSATVAAAGPAAAAPTPQTTGCSAWAQAGATKYYVRECAGMFKSTPVKHIKETVYVKNMGTHTLPPVTGSVSVSWSQAGTGAGFSGLSVSPGHTKSLTRSFRISVRGTYTVAASITVSKHSAHVQTKLVN